MLPGLIDDFYQDTDRLMAQARQAIRAKQAEELRRAAHSLRSSSATLGATELSRVAHDLEACARQGSLREARGLLEKAQAEFIRARAALETVRKEG
jgi:HPt (histidine-containing phosphotransfer) domain-containing protein